VRSLLASPYVFELLGAGALLLQFFNIPIRDAFRAFITGIVVYLLARHVSICANYSAAP